jgi:hypothetical protein
MDVTDLDLCVVLPIAVLDAWVRADPATRAGWLAGSTVVSEVQVGAEVGFVFRREPPRPTRAVVSIEPRRRVAIVISGADEAAVRAAIDAPAEYVVLADRARVPSGLLVIGGDLAHADVGGGTPVAGPHRIVDLAPGDYRVELRTVGAAGEADFARVIVYQPR